MAWKKIIEGEQGPTGNTGKSAYQIWLDQGFTGSELDFIHFLRGADGGDGTDILKDKRIGLIGSSSIDIDYTQHADKNFMVYISERTGCELVNYANGGSHLTGASSGTNQRYKLSQLPDDVDAVLLQVGLNDDIHERPMGQFGSTNTSEFYGALDVICRDLYDKYPTKPFGFLTGQYAGNITAESSPYHEAIKRVCGYYGIPVCDLKSEGRTPYTYPNWQEVYAADGLHMNDAGNFVLSKRVESFLRSLFGH